MLSDVTCSEFPIWKKKGLKGLQFCKEKYSSRYKWQHGGIPAAWQIPQICQRALFYSLISWKPEEMAIKCKCRTSSKKIVQHVMSLLKLLVILTLTNLRDILVYNTKHHKHYCSERCSPKSWPPKKDKRYRLHQRNIIIETGESKTRQREAMTRFSGIALIGE